MSIPLLVRLKNKDTGQAVDAGFRRSPVRIGRNPLNDLAIDETFVSQWHGLLRFDDEGTRFLDLGSTNGTKLGGDRLAKNVEVELQEDSELRIGPLRVTVARVPLTDDQILPRRASAFSLGGTRRATQGQAESGTVELAGTKSVSADEAFMATLQQDGKVGARDLKGIAERQKAFAQRLHPAYAAYEAAYGALREVLWTALDETTTQEEREARRVLLAENYGLAFEHGELRRQLEIDAVGGAVDAPDWMERLAPGIMEGWDQPADALERAGAVLETFAQAYVDLREGQKQVAEQLNVDQGSEVGTLPSFRDARALLAYLLEASVDGEMRVDELSRAFADLALHQMGMVAGAVDGARAALLAIGPQTIAGSAATGLVQAAPTFGDFLWPFRAMGYYYRFVAQHMELLRGDSFTSHLFGTAFARAYYRVTGQR